MGGRKTFGKEVPACAAGKIGRSAAPTTCGRALFADHFVCSRNTCRVNIPIDEICMASTRTCDRSSNMHSERTSGDPMASMRSVETRAFVSDL
jgi:hypothetical protein